MSVDSPEDPKYLVYKLVPIEYPMAAEGPDIVSVNGKLFEKHDLPEGEPVFVLRGQDRDAEAMVYIYAGTQVAREGRSERVSRIIAHADEFRRWTPKKAPD